jgi:PAS domain S-box-containing protein
MTAMLDRAAAVACAPSCTPEAVFAETGIHQDPGRMNLSSTNSTAKPVQPNGTADAETFFTEQATRVYRRIDRLFAHLMVCQWFACVAAAIVVSGLFDASGGLQMKVYAAIIVGGLANLVPAGFAILWPGQMKTRLMISGGQAMTSVLLTCLTNGQIETNFHMFGSLALLSFYRDWRALVPATLVTATFHCVRGMCLPQVEAAVAAGGPTHSWHWLESVGWVLFIGVFLTTAACMRGVREMRAIAERAAEASSRNAELAATRDTALDCIITIDHTGLITQFNPAAERTFGYKREEVIGRPFVEVVVAPQGREAFQQGLTQYLRTGESTVIGKRMEIAAVGSDGHEIPVEAAITAVKLDGPPVFVAYVRDITKHKRWEEQARISEKLALVASRTDNAVIITDPAGNIEWINDGFTRITGYGLDEVIGMKPGSLLQGPDTDPATVKLMREHLAAGEGFRTEIVNYTRTGKPYWIAVEVQPVRDAEGTLRYFMAIESDISERKEAEKALVAAKEEAERIRVEAVNASKAKSQFLANMSHEIRTPLNGVIGMAELLIRRGGLSEQQLRYTQVIKSSADTLLALINDVLDFSKIEAGKLELSCVDFDLREAVEQVTEMLAPKASARKLEFACRVDPSIPQMLNGDPERLRQILINLATNAIKFTEKGEVLIRVESEPGSPPDKIGLRFSVRDTGVGIPQDRLDRLFKSFSQVDASTTRKYGGTGLGLAISKQLSELMGGRIGVDSVAGQGSTFWFIARLGRTTAKSTMPWAAGATNRLDAASLRGTRILAVDDHATARDVLKDQLEGWGFDVTLACDGVEALEKLRAAAAEERPFRLAIVDLMMPNLDGRGVADTVKVDPVLSQTKLVLLTALDNPLDGADMHQSGFAACITKPIRQSHLFDAVVRAVAAGSPGGAAVEHTPLPAVAAQPLKGVNILLAEDNEVNQEVARELLLDAGCIIEVVGNGKLASEAVAARRYDIVLMDCQMPEMDGFEATGTIRRREQANGTPRQPIIALTANAVEGDREKCLAAGMDSYVSKPIDPEALLAAIKSLVKTPVAPQSDPTPGSELLRKTELVDADLAKDPGLRNTSDPASTVHAPAAAAHGPDVVPIDVPSLLKRCSGKAALAEKLLGKFELQLAGQIESLKQTIADHDQETLARVAHTIKGSAANLSAEGIRGLAGELEHLFKNAAYDDAEQCLQRLANEVQRCVAFLPQAIAELGAKAPAKNEPVAAKA